ncbi:cycle-inhibiting factor [Cedecea neteri]|uniref:cycle-inhibiting factor n=1 Tax=Cedecea neteri TaxID=158822 RepID=UPI0028A00921|nr:cycle-inhibiting factor [Cedecea neteri]
MRNILNTFRPAQSDPRLQAQSGQSSRTTRTSATASSSRSVNNPSTRLVQDFAKLSGKNLRANVLLNSDDNSVPIHHKSPSALLKAIDDNISNTARDWGMPKHEVEAMLGSSKRINEPVCGVTANNVMKLFLDTDHFSYAFEHGRTMSLPQLQQQLANLPAHKHFILRVNDAGMGHAYVIDLPASTKPRRDAFLYQSDLGDGATRPLRLDDWMSKKASQPVSLNDINTHFMNMAHGRIDPGHIAKLFDVDSNPNMLRPERLDLQKNQGFNFQLAEYDPANLERNVSAIKARCG